jgi:hypothetical protein
MRRLVYSTSLSLDGYIDSTAGDVERNTDTLLYGRRMYEIMAGYWPTADEDPSASSVIVEYAQIWKPIPKLVFSSTLESVDWNSRLIRSDAVAEVARLKAQPGGGTLGVGGLLLASALASAGLIDEYRLLCPGATGLRHRSVLPDSEQRQTRAGRDSHLFFRDGAPEMRSRRPRLSADVRRLDRHGPQPL